MASLDLEEWITNSNTCFNINFTRSSKRIHDESFNPRFTYPIFNDAESIIGYKNPNIELDFRANDLHPSLKIQFDAKVDLSSMLGEDDEQIDLENIFKEYFPSYVFDPTEASKEASVAPDPSSKSWKPPGKLIHSFSLHGKQYEIWKASLTDDAARKIWQNMQILVLLFIEGASLPELDEFWSQERWTLYLMYEVTPLKDDAVTPYTLAGFSTSYRYWILPTFDIMRSMKSLPSPPESSNGDRPKYTPPRLTQDTETFLFKEHIDALAVPSRERISQFLILPPYQGQSLGSKLYETTFEYLHKQTNIFEIAVEDPNEEFDAMRDYSDFAYLQKLPAFKSLSVVSSLPPEDLRKDSPIPRDRILGGGVDLEALRHEAKIVPRQFNRVLELYLLSQIPPTHRNRARLTRKEKSSNENDRRYYFWRLALKHRIYCQNADVLDQLEDSSEKVEKLENAVDNQQAEFEERLEGVRRREKWNAGEITPKAENSRSKRKRVVVDEDDWEDVDDEESVSSKRARA